MVTMKNALTKNTLREITKSKSRFLSILIIVAIGVAFFAGVRATSPEMKFTADKYLDDNNTADLTIQSLNGFKQSDIDKVKKIVGVSEVYGGYSFDALAINDDSEKAIKIHSLKIGEKSVNNPVLVDGAMPTNEGEAVTEKTYLEKENLKIGDYIKIKTVNGTKDFKITGIVNSPLYINTYQRGANSLGNGSTSGFFQIGEKSAKELALPKIPEIPGIKIEDIYTELSIIVDDAKSKNTFLDEYKDLVNEVKEKIEAVDKNWYIKTRDSNEGIRGFQDDSDRIKAIGTAFPLIFFLVATLVCLTTMTRMVEEHRIQIGTLKALGYSKFSIVSQYFIYAFTASVIGSIIGVILGFKIFPFLIFNAYRIMYTIPPVVGNFHIDLAITSALVAIFCTTLAAVGASIKELVAVPAILMRPKAPKAGKRILLERIRFIWKRMSFTEKVTARNILRYKKRFFMTVIGVAGCTTLLITGFGLKDSIVAVTEKQFGEIYTYDLKGYLRESIHEDKEYLFMDELKDYDEIEDSLLSFEKNIKVESNNKENSSVEGYILIPKDVDKLNEFINLREENGKIDIGDNGVVITKKLSKLLNIKEGDNIEISLDDKTVNATVNHITEHYVSHYVYMSPKYYEKLFDDKVNYNAFSSKLKNKDTNQEDKLSKEMMKNPKIATINFTTSISDSFKKTMDSVDSVILVLIASAGALAFVVMYNLTNINISERMRELATIKVLGFYDKEVAGYVYRENIILSIIGTLVGVILGVFLHKYVITTAETDMVMFSREIKIMSFIYSAILTIVFSSLVNIVMYKKLKKINMVESLKSAE
ncbi:MULTISPECIES: ABC transporter permease [unclassified Clostridium]|uniref:ABC transporter permease n=1 Tax=unclassified Clostridium TaxID=2614128 RepID=UPI0025BF008D|nr:MULTISPECIES: ABC transporter permease [unclassified Clostridium]